MINVILCGGSGTRLWPLSRTMLPKQFVRLFNDRSLFQDTVLRNQSVCRQSFIISNTEQYFLAVDQFEHVSIHQTQFLLEPIGRNTAPAIALACMALDEDDLVLVTPSDHLVKDQIAYDGAVLKAKALAEQGKLVTFGIKPTYPETGFGYIEASGNDVLSFKEKPSAEFAQSYIEHGNYYWNSGMFCFKAGVFLEELKQHAPEMYETCQAAIIEAKDKTLANSNNSLANVSTSSVIRISIEAMQAIPEDSIDYAVMEKSDKVNVVPCDMKWSDLGSFDALYTEVEKTENNAFLPMSDMAPEPICIDANNNLLVTGDRKIAIVDVDDLLVVDTSDALLIAKKGSSQKVKQVVAEIKKRTPELAEINNLVHRPWGSYEVLISHDNYKVKRIVVSPNHRLSLQKHFHRNEHWVVVSGTATVSVDNDSYLVRPNESTYIKMGQKHRLENQGEIDLVVIEVQVGEYTGEDDIVRFDDMYGR
jgi:mannose-1-phosphate guanylyltransferase